MVIAAHPVPLLFSMEATFPIGCSQAMTEQSRGWLKQAHSRDTLDTPVGNSLCIFHSFNWTLWNCSAVQDFSYPTLLPPSSPSWESDLHGCLRAHLSSPAPSPSAFTGISPSHFLAYLIHSWSLIFGELGLLGNWSGSETIFVLLIHIKKSMDLLV